MAQPLVQDPSSTTSILLTANHLGRRHPGASSWLFREIQIEIAAGDRLALVGPTGSGKTLILRALALLDPIDEGEIRWCGGRIPDREVPEYRARVLYLQQRSPVIEGTVGDNLKAPFQLHVRKGSQPHPTSVAQLLESLGKDQGFLTARTSNLSGGERQIVALARALLVSPTILLLDEPSAALDPRTTSTLEHLVDAWQRDAPTERAFLWVSHDPEQAQRVSRRILRLEAGHIEAAE